MSSQFSVRCLPKAGLWLRYYLESGDQTAHLTLSYWGWKGKIHVDEQQLQVRRHGWWSAHWTLTRNGVQLVTAHKRTPFSQTLEIRSERNVYQLQPSAPLGRGCQLRQGRTVVADIYPDHSRSLRATMDAIPELVDFTTLAMAFCLVATMWRRS